MGTLTGEATLSLVSILKGNNLLLWQIIIFLFKGISEVDPTDDRILTFKLLSEGYIIKRSDKNSQQLSPFVK